MLTTRKDIQPRLIRFGRGKAISSSYLAISWQSVEIKGSS